MPALPQRRETNNKRPPLPCGRKHKSKHDGPTHMPATPCLLGHPAPLSDGGQVPETRLRPTCIPRPPTRRFVKPPHSSTQKRARVCVCQCGHPTNRGLGDAGAAFNVFPQHPPYDARPAAGRMQRVYQLQRDTHTLQVGIWRRQREDAVRPLVGTCGARDREIRGPVTGRWWPPS